ncbi:MAG: SH3 domain-containing protein [Cyanobacteria bacterium P01_C01_bin.120]
MEEWGNEGVREEEHEARERLRRVGLWLLVGLWAQPLVMWGQSRPGTIAEPIWETWRALAEFDAANVVTGLTNADFGVQFEFEQSCERTAGPDAEISHWFRVSTLVAAIGVGRVEYGCWVDGAFLKTRSTAAFHNDALSETCLQVDVDQGGGLNLRSGPGLDQPRLGTLVNGTQGTWTVSARRFANG